MSAPIEHVAACYECDGTGAGECVEPVCDGGGDDPCAHATTCTRCGGEGDVLWAWDPQAPDVCEHCKRPGPCDGWGEDGEDAVCLDCAREAHKSHCGCDAAGWK